MGLRGSRFQPVEVQGIAEGVSSAVDVAKAIQSINASKAQIEQSKITNEIAKGQYHEEWIRKIVSADDNKIKQLYVDRWRAGSAAIGSPLTDETIMQVTSANNRDAIVQAITHLQQGAPEQKAQAFQTLNRALTSNQAGALLLQISSDAAQRERAEVTAAGHAGRTEAAREFAQQRHAENLGFRKEQAMRAESNTIRGRIAPVLRTHEDAIAEIDKFSDVLAEMPPEGIATSNLALSFVAVANKGRPSDKDYALNIAKSRGVKDRIITQLQNWKNGASLSTTQIGDMKIIMEIYREARFRSLARQLSPEVRVIN
jgi:hypothetical protein